jgi:hypothetical protein
MSSQLIENRYIMDIQMLTSFLMWCTILNGALLIFWTLACMAAPNLVYKVQSYWFPIPRETFVVIIYSFLGLFKVMFIVFNLVPLVALWIIK